MTYTTNAAHELVDTFQCRIVRNRTDAEQARTRSEFIKAAVFDAWADATQRALIDLEAAITQIEAEARLVPSPDLDIYSLREMLLREEGLVA